MLNLRNKKSKLSKNRLINILDNLVSGRWGDGHFIYEETEERMPINCPCFYTKYNKESFISMQACLTLNPGFYFLVFVSPCGMGMVPFHQSWKFKIKI